MENLEIEYKVMINKDDFIRLENNLINLNFNYYIQTNYYFDTSNNVLKDHKYSLRIRHIENLNKYILTLKTPENDGRREYEYEVNSTNINNANEKVKKILFNINVNIEELIEIANLKTIRKEYKIKDTLVCLDHNFYNNLEDYEIECEAINMNKAKETIVNMLNKYNINYKESKYSKVARARKKHLI